ncbi:hypothetical protein BDP27DRAFT_1295935 [Rhodocollybia butyracea]|uniref:SWI/SNF and RSC complexes subunit Ssr4 N-terminal domain-containing protein n=1 Tax=Rhodocollybia butyracea TaxID=206335 RepID=A0A9P5PQR2_9AGAR|nr:hypothetical protein BDP27DRAFT_1295935 [Rhodocollybia butyracea]
MPSSTLAEIQQLQSEGLVLRYPEVLLHQQITLEGAVNLLMKAAQQALTVPFVWTWLDRPQDGQTFIVFLPNPHAPFTNDGIRWTEPETRFTIGQNTPKELEVGEVKFGFVPSSTAGPSETLMIRVRRRYRLIHSGLSQLWVVHYSFAREGARPPVPPALAGQPVRMYPLRQVNEAAMFVTGEKIGQKVFPQGMQQQQGMPPQGMSPQGMQQQQQQPGMPFNQHQAQAMLAHQNSNMDMLEARRREAAARAGLPPPPAHLGPAAGQGTRGPPPGMGGPRPRGEDDDSGDEVDSISTRTLATMRYKRNHDIMNEVLANAAFNKRSTPTKSSPYSVFDQKEVDEKVAKITSEIETLKTRAEERRAERQRKQEQEKEELAAFSTSSGSIPIPEVEVDVGSIGAIGGVPGMDLGVGMGLGAGMDVGGMGMGMGDMGGMGVGVGDMSGMGMGVMGGMGGMGAMGGMGGAGMGFGAGAGGGDVGMGGMPQSVW